MIALWFRIQSHRCTQHLYGLALSLFVPRLVGTQLVGGIPWPVDLLICHKAGKGNRYYAVGRSLFAAPSFNSEPGGLATVWNNLSFGFVRRK
jgi:hypothetical protein